MSFFYILTMLSFCLQAIFLTIAIAAGLYYLAELMEEYSELTKTVLTWIILASCALQCALWASEGLAWSLHATALAAQALHARLLHRAPARAPHELALAFLLILLHHYLAATSLRRDFSETLAYFTVLVWPVPLALLAAAAQGDCTLPTANPHAQDVVADFLSQPRRRGLRWLLDGALQRDKKAF